MPSKAGSLIFCILFSVQTILPGMSARQSFAADAEKTSQSILRTSSKWTKSVILGSAARTVRVANLELNLVGEAIESSPISVNIECFGKEDTPALALDKHVYGPTARLLNLTRLQAAECTSFGVAVAPDTAGVDSQRTDSTTSSRLAVGVHHSGELQSDKVGNPAVFIFNPTQGNWSEAKVHSPAVRNSQTAYATLTKHYQRLIVGVIAQPDALQSEPARNTPSSLSASLEQVSASDGYLAVDAIEPDNKGDYSVNLPLLLRPSRGPGPSFSIAYSSQANAGVLGRGWDLSLSSIEVRGAAPIYHPDFETEDYLLDGMDLIPLDGAGADIAPLYKGGPIIRRVEGPRFFRLRNSSSGLIVRRHGNSPSTYFWEVWNPNSHVTRLYGGKFTSSDAPPMLDDDRNGLLLAKAAFSGGISREVVGQWGLTQEYDNQPARSGTSYRYMQNDVSGRQCSGELGKLACWSALRLKEVRYSRAFGLLENEIDPSGETQVEFEWQYRDDERRHNSDGRLGFLRAQQHWLKGVSVKYRPDSGNLWLASTVDPKPGDQAIFSTHKFELTAGDNACMNYDVVLSKYRVDGNPRYDAIASSQEQIFTFSYEGEKFASSAGVCDRMWSDAKALSPADLGNLPKDAPGGAISFPADLLKNFGLGLLAEQSFLGTGRIEETGASVYLGVGPPGDTSVKPVSVGFKGGYNFTKAETNSILVDVTGDGIDDIVSRQGGELRYCGGLRSSITHFVTYPETRCGRIEGINDIARSSTSTLSAGAEVSVYGSIFAGIGFNRSDNASYIYFTQRDGDGLIDLAAYGQVYYGQGETIEGADRVVRFLTNSALTPPLPGRNRDKEISKHLPRDLRATILNIESRLETTARRLHELDYSQTTLAWEAPLDGTVSLAGLFEGGETSSETAPEGGLDPDFGADDFKGLFDEVEKYKKYAYNCDAWPEKDFCHQRYSDPYEPQYERPLDEFSFIRTFDSRLRVSLYRRATGAVITCREVGFGGLAEIKDLDFDDQCLRQGAKSKEIDVHAGDVLYLSYSIHPHAAKWIKPHARIDYVSVDNDPAFAIAKTDDAEGVLGQLPCNWNLGAKAIGANDCTLNKLSPYTFDLQTGVVASQPNRAIELTPGRERTFNGRFLIPTWLTQNYAVYFDILAGQIVKKPGKDGMVELIPGPVPVDTLRRIYRLDVSAQCVGQGETCSVTLAPTCGADNLNQEECIKFVSLEKEHLAVAARLVVEHRIKGAEIAVRNVDSVLQNLIWTQPPHIRTILTKLDPQPEGEKAPGSDIERYSLIYLPMSMGQEDVEYFRIETGAYDNPDVDMNEGDPQPEIINFGTMMTLEDGTIRFTRIRQTLELCRFADEILTYLNDTATEHASPFAQGYLNYWTDKYDKKKYSERCDKARNDFAKATFTGNDGPDMAIRNRLNLAVLLRNLSHDERLASAETLFQRVLANLMLGDQFLTDDHRLTRRGYRLPTKVNPLDCGMLSQTEVPLDAPIIDYKGRQVPDCAYRLLANFAMEDFEGLIGKDNAANLRAMLAPLSKSTAPAFRVELAATVNGRPVAFRELTGADSGNDPCKTAIKNTCIEKYGTTGDDLTGVKEYFYPKGDGTLSGPNPADPTAGDVLQRVTTNKRTGRAVAFSNSIMSPKVPPECERKFPLYKTSWQMEAKQDCMLDNSDASIKDPKYLGPASYVVSYEITENNRFVGRNRVVQFRANPLDIVEFQIRIVPVEQSIELVPGDPTSKVRGAFSVIDGTKRPFSDLVADRHLIPRSPSDILPDPSDILPTDTRAVYNCPKAPTQNSFGTLRRLPTTCRPWSRLGWAELLLGAEYRTYSDAQKTGRKDEYSIKRRREILRLQPEVEVRADRYFLQQTDNPNAVLVGQLTPGSNVDIVALRQALDAAKMPQDVTIGRQKELLIFHSNEPRVSKTGGALALIGHRAPKDGSLANIPAFPELRFGTSEQTKPITSEGAYKRSSDACGSEDDPNLDGCESQMVPEAEASLALDNADIFALEHRFVGPVDGGPASGDLPDILEDTDATKRIGIGQCSVARPNATASCWKGPDDTVLLEEPIMEKGLDARSETHSISALTGFERPPLAEFLFEFDAYKRLACLDPVIQEPDLALGLCEPGGEVTEPSTSLLEFPNRQNTPETNIAVYAPVQASNSRSVSHNIGALLFNKNSSTTQREQETAFIDVNGDGFPEVVTDGHADLTSPVGLTRSDWWRYFRVEENMPSLAAELRADDLDQNAKSVSKGEGIGLSPSTFAVFKQKGSNTKESGSPDAVLDPSFSLDRESGHDETFTELRDFNGDGLADQLTGQTVGDGLALGFNTGGTVVKAIDTNMLAVDGIPLSALHFNSSNSTGFGIRLGFSVESGSYGAGMGLAHRDSGSVATLMDFTGDGRPDIVVPAEQPGGKGNLLVFPNLGNGFGSGRWHTIAKREMESTSFTETTLVDAGGFYTTGFNALFVKVVVNAAAKFTRGQTRELLNFRDINGDGFPDLAMVKGTFQKLDGNDYDSEVYYNPEARYHLLTGVTNPSGSRYLLSHDLYGNDSAAHGSPVWALTEVARYDGFEPREAALGGKLPDDGHDVTLTRYTYEKGYFNRAERRFYGFARRVSTVFGCDLATAGQECIKVFETSGRLTEDVLEGVGYRKLQIVDLAYSNRDFLTQGMVLSQRVQGFKSLPLDDDDKAAPADIAQSVSVTHYGYTLDEQPSDAAATILGPDNLEYHDNCETPTATDRLSAVWEPASENAGSILPALWDGSIFKSEHVLLGAKGLCETGGPECARKLAVHICRTGFVSEQRGFWAQLGGSVRLRLESLEVFGGDVTPEQAISPATPRLQSEVAFDYDQWGQVQTFYNIGEATPEKWAPDHQGSVYAKINYANRQGLDKGSAVLGYPLLGLAEEIRIFGGAWPKNDGSLPLRVRQALYSEDGRGNLTDICTFPITGLRISSTLCADYKRTFDRHLGDGYSTLQAALRATYEELPELPKGTALFDAVIHHRLVGYDKFGNLTHAVSPLTLNKEWIERRFSYAADPFRRIATTTALTRCVENVVGAGKDTDGVDASDDHCGFGADSLPEAVRRTAITHRSTARVDSHTGSVAETTDINGNSVLIDFDRWGRFRLIARNWGNIARENRSFASQLRLAMAKSLAVNEAPKDVTSTDGWRILALADYERVSDGLLRSNLRRFEPSESYSGLLITGKTTRESALFADGNGRTIQSLREADVCTGVPDDLISGVKNVTKDGLAASPKAILSERCKVVATAIATPSSATDALGRDLLSFEPYPVIDAADQIAASTIIDNYKKPRFQALALAKTKPKWLSRTTFDAGGRPTLVQSRLALKDEPPANGIRGSTQYRYRVLPGKKDGGSPERLARFEAFTLSPRCSASAAWSDARGLIRTLFEDQSGLHRNGIEFGDNSPKDIRVTAPSISDTYERDYSLSLGDCENIERVAEKLSPAMEQSAAVEWSEANDDVLTPLQPARISYAYDPLQQLTNIDYPLAGETRAKIAARYDMIGRMTELHEPNSGCTSYRYDPMNLLVAVHGFRFEPEGKPCGTNSSIANEKNYRYSADRLIEISYRSLEEQNGEDDRRDAVRFYYDRYPHAQASAELLEGLRYVPNDDANRRFLDVTGRECNNCIGQMTIVSDRSGARSFSYNELGLPSRGIRSIVAPLQDAGLLNSGGDSETYLPEVAFHEVESSYTAFGDLVRQRFSESAPSNPHKKCVKDGIETCLARFTIGRKYAPDGAIAELLFNDRPLISAAQDALARPAIRWTADGTVTGYGYDANDLRLNQLATLTSGVVDGGVLPVQVNGYQYDGGGNVLAYINRAIAKRTNPETDSEYESAFGFGYDAVNRLVDFDAAVRKGTEPLKAHGHYSYDEGHRFVTRDLTIGDGKNSKLDLVRNWKYFYGIPADAKPLHAPSHIDFAANDNKRDTKFNYDDLGRMTRIGEKSSEEKQQPGLLTNRALRWDAEGRLTRVRGVKDGAVEANEQWLREDYVYDAGGNRTLRIHRPRVDLSAKPLDEEKSATATIYLTPFYAKTLDRRGTVQLAEGNLPAASLDAPADSSETPVVSYVYSDLAVGSMTASVTNYGEATDASAIVIGRREYSPYGLELTADWLADTGRPDTAKLSVFHGKELDRITNFSSFGARSYSRDLGIWISPDPMMTAYLSGQPAGGIFAAPNLSSYAYAHLRPTAANDPDGEFLNFVAGAAAGVAVDLAVQGVLIAGGAQDNISWSSVAISAASGATGVGLSSVVARSAARYGASKLAVKGVMLLGETAIAVGEQKLQGEDIDVGNAALNVVLGEAAGVLGSKIAKRIAALSKYASADDFVKTRMTKHGDKGVRITRPDGSWTDIDPRRVKEGRLNTHPKAPPGTIDRVEYPNALPGSKGLKRAPTAEELKYLDSLE